jgi:hypothetical protein
VIQQATRGGDEYIGAGAQGLDLRVDIDAAENGGGLQRQMPAVDTHALLHLRREFARRCQHQGADGPSRRFRSGIKALQQRQCKTGGLAGACLRRRHDIAAFKNNGDRLALDGGGFSVALLADGAQQFGREAEFVERHTQFCSR